jgi:DNA-binding winged helix-turn-helix (wHTH) protein
MDHAARIVKLRCATIVVGNGPVSAREVNMGALRSTTVVERLPRAQSAALVQFRPHPRFDVRRDLEIPEDDTPFPATRTGPGRAPTEISFGPFRVIPKRFLLLDGEEQVPLGSRALEVLIVLLERPGELVSKQELIARVWPNTFVDPGNLAVHISALRRALRDGRDGNRFIINIPGRGYSFVASVELYG